MTAILVQAVFAIVSGAALGIICLISLLGLGIADGAARFVSGLLAVIGGAGCAFCLAVGIPPIVAALA